MPLRLVRPDAPEAAQDSSRPARSSKLARALQGIKLGARAQSSVFAHLFMATLVGVTAAALSCTLTDWCLLLGCIAAVFATELFFSAFDVLIRPLTTADAQAVGAALSMAAGGAMIIRATAALIGALVLGRHMWHFVAPSMGL